MGGHLKKTSILLNGFFLAALLGNFYFWMQAKNTFVQWDNVPSVPSHTSAALSGLGDAEITYRLFGYFLQNVGNTGGKYESLKSYDYAALENWFTLSQSLDPQANYVPFMAAYFFGALEDEPKKIAHVISFLAQEGMRPYPEKWRWLAHAVYLARYNEKNMDKALFLANQLSKLPDAAPWARQMPAFIQLEEGNKEAAYEIMIQMLASEKDKIHPNEVNFMRNFICTRTLDKAQAAKNPLCADGS